MLYVLPDEVQRRLLMAQSTGSMSNKTTFSKLDDDSLGVPDGLCQDEDYGCWSARWGAGKVTRFDEHGQLDLIVEFPKGLNMTSCIFGSEFHALHEKNWAHHITYCLRCEYG